MGAFFTNIQIRSPRSNADAITQYMRNLAAQSGYTTVAEASEETDRDIYIITKTNATDWVIVCDSGLENQLPDELLMATKRLAKVADGIAVGVAVSDSDVLQLHYCSKGRHIDSFSNMLDDGNVSVKLRHRLIGNAEKWKKLLVTGATPEQITACWKNHHVFVEEMLMNFCNLVALDFESCTLDASTFNQAIPDGFVVLHHLRLKQPFSLSDSYVRDKPSAYETAGGTIALEGVKGDEIGLGHGESAELRNPLSQGQHMVCFQNRGGPSTGLIVGFTGTAIDQDLISVKQVVIRCRDTEIRATPELKQVGEGSKAVFIKLADYVIHPGLDKEKEIELRSKIGFIKWYKFHLNHDTSIYIQGSYLNPGTGTLQVFIAPLNNVSEGASAVSMSIAVKEAKE